MTPRPYTQRRRARTALVTRDAIVDAAMSVYRDVGLRDATMKAIAERADVARGTILNHFGDADGLLDAVLDRILATLEMPDERVLDRADSDEARIRAYVAAMVGFFRRSATWWPVFESAMQRPHLKAREADYFVAIGRLQDAALGPELASDPTLRAAVSGMIHPATMGQLLWTLESGGMATDDSARVIEDLVVGYVAVHTRRGGRRAQANRASA